LTSADRRYPARDPRTARAGSVRFWAFAALSVALLGGAFRASGQTPVPASDAVAAPSGAGANQEKDASEATAVIERFHASMLAVLREAETLGYEGRFRRVAPTVEEAFDLPYMAEKVVGGEWKKLGESERQRWLLTFGQFMKANYAGRFTGYTGQQFDTLGSESGAHGTMVVRTRLRNPSGEDVDLIYRLRSTTAGWRIIDIFLKGTVSELALRRSEYSAVLERDGFDSLLKVVEARIADLASGKE
jgi:phospholipid transport system substrate-binding protein